MSEFQPQILYDNSKIAHTSNFGNNGGLNCIVHFICDEMERTGNERDIEGIYQSEWNAKLLESFFDFYKLEDVVGIEKQNFNINMLKKIIQQYPNPIDREVILSPVLREYQKKIKQSLSSDPTEISLLVATANKLGIGLTVLDDQAPIAHSPDSGPQLGNTIKVLHNDEQPSSGKLGSRRKLKILKQGNHWKYESQLEATALKERNSFYMTPIPPPNTQSTIAPRIKAEISEDQAGSDVAVGAKIRTTLQRIRSSDHLSVRIPPRPADVKDAAEAASRTKPASSSTGPKEPIPPSPEVSLRSNISNQKKPKKKKSVIFEDEVNSADPIRKVRDNPQPDEKPKIKETFTLDRLKEISKKISEGIAKIDEQIRSYRELLSEEIPAEERNNEAYLNTRSMIENNFSKTQQCHKELNEAKKKLEKTIERLTSRNQNLLNIEIDPEDVMFLRFKDNAKKPVTHKLLNDRIEVWINKYVSGIIGNDKGKVGREKEIFLINNFVELIEQSYPKSETDRNRTLGDRASAFISEAVERARDIRDIQTNSYQPSFADDSSETGMDAPTMGFGLYSQHAESALESFQRDIGSTAEIRGKADPDKIKESFDWLKTSIEEGNRKRGMDTTLHPFNNVVLESGSNERNLTMRITTVKGTCTVMRQIDNENNVTSQLKGKDPGDQAYLVFALSNAPFAPLDLQPHKDPQKILKAMEAFLKVGVKFNIGDENRKLFEDRELYQNLKPEQRELYRILTEKNGEVFKQKLSELPPKEKEKRKLGDPFKPQGPELTAGSIPAKPRTHQ